MCNGTGSAKESANKLAVGEEIGYGHPSIYTPSKSGLSYNPTVRDRVGPKAKKADEAASKRR